MANSKTSPPTGHVPLGPASLNRLTLKEGAIFFDGVKLKADIGLTRAQENTAIAVAVVTVVSLTVAGIKDGRDLLRDVGWLKSPPTMEESISEMNRTDLTRIYCEIGQILGKEALDEKC